MGLWLEELMVENATMWEGEKFSFFRQPICGCFRMDVAMLILNRIGGLNDNMGDGSRLENLCVYLMLFLYSENLIA